jgi:hypothetical protein
VKQSDIPQKKKLASFEFAWDNAIEEGSTPILSHASLHTSFSHSAFKSGEGNASSQLR